MRSEVALVLERYDRLGLQSLTCDPSAFRLTMYLRTALAKMLWFPNSTLCTYVTAIVLLHTYTMPPTHRANVYQGQQSIEQRAIRVVAPRSTVAFQTFACGGGLKAQQLAADFNALQHRILRGQRARLVQHHLRVCMQTLQWHIEMHTFKATSTVLNEREHSVKGARTQH